LTISANFNLPKAIFKKIYFLNYEKIGQNFLKLTDGITTLKRSLSHQSLLTETETRSKDFQQFPLCDGISSKKNNNSNNNNSTLEDKPSSGSKIFI